MATKQYRELDLALPRDEERELALRYRAGTRWGNVTHNGEELFEIEPITDDCFAAAKRSPLVESYGTLKHARFSHAPKLEYRYLRFLTREDMFAFIARRQWALDCFDAAHPRKQEHFLESR